MPLLSIQWHFLHLKWIFNSELVSSRWPRKISLSLPVAWGSHLGITFSKSPQLSFVTWAKIRTFTIPVQVNFTFKMSNFLYYFIQKHSFLQEKRWTTTDLLSGPQERFSPIFFLAAEQCINMSDNLSALLSNEQYSDNVLSQPTLPQNIIQPSLMHRACHHLLSAKKVAS